MDLALILASGVGWIVAAQLGDHRAVAIAAMIAAWALWLAARARLHPATWDELGLRTGGFRDTLRAAAPVSVASAAVLLAIGAWKGAFPLPVGFWISLLLYPAWGTVQQAITQGMVAGGLRDRLPLPAVVVLTAAAFAAVHVPHLPVMVATAGLALVFTPIFLRYRNVLALGVLHGWLGALLYYCALGRDPIGEIVASIRAR